MIEEATSNLVIPLGLCSDGRGRRRSTNVEVPRPQLRYAVRRCSADLSEGNAMGNFVGWTLIQADGRGDLSPGLLRVGPQFDELNHHAVKQRSVGLEAWEMTRRYQKQKARPYQLRWRRSCLLGGSSCAIHSFCFAQGKKSSEQVIITKAVPPHKHFICSHIASAAVAVCSHSPCWIFLFRAFAHWNPVDGG